MSIVKVKAILMRNICFLIEGSEVEYKSGTEILVDPENNIGIYNNVHFDLIKSEYRVMYVN